VSSTFGSFNIATSGLFASQRSLDIVNHNIANSNTEGYSKQKIKQKAEQAMYGDARGVIGTGVNTYDIYRIKSEYLDNKYWGQNKTYNEWKVKEAGMGELEALFNEPSNTGIRKVMDELFASLEELSKKPGDSTNRVAVVEKANTLAITINRNGNELVNNIRDTNFNIKSNVQEVNSIAKQLTALNKQIFNFELSGNKANDLRDQRSVLIDNLSGIINIDVSEYKDMTGNGKMVVRIGGVTLVDHDMSNEIAMVDNDVPGVTDMGGGKLTTLTWKDLGNQPVNIQGGTLKGLLDLRDGDGQGSNYRGLMFYLNNMNEFARDFSNEFNNQHKNGVDYYGNIGGDFFDSTEPVNCLNLKVSTKVFGDSNLIAASTSANGQSNNINTALLIDFRKQTNLFISVKGTPDDFIKSFISALAVDSSQAERMMENNSLMVGQTNNSRLSESGVSLDEEMTDLVKFQTTYNASARMITTLDAILDTMVNRLGMVGR